MTTPSREMTAMRVLRIITRLNIGGPAMHAGVLTHGLDPARFDTTLVIGQCRRDEGDMSAQVLTPQARVMRLPWLQRSLHPLKDLVTWWQLVRIIRRVRPHLVHTHMAKAGALGRCAAWVAGKTMRRTDRPVVIHTFHGHVLDGYFSPWTARCFAGIERWLARRTHQLIAVSPAVKDDLIQRGIAPSTQIRVIPLGLPLDACLRVNGRRHVWRTREETDLCTMVWVGRLVPIKQAELFVRSLRLLRTQRPACRWRAVLAGDGESRPSVERAIIEAGVADVVRCVGWVTDIPALYADADVVCLTSRNEGTPVSLIEAMAAGRPVVATAVGGVPDVLGVERAATASIAPGSYLRGDGGLLVRSGDAEGLAAALAVCAEDSALRRALGAAGRQRVRDRYAATRLIRDVEQLYLRWCGDRVAVRAPAPREAAACAS